MADWYLNQWLDHFGKKQADIVRDLDWNKAKVSLTAAGKQAYNRDDVKEIADWLELRPYELLMHPKDALAIRQLRATAETIVTGDFEAVDPVVEQVAFGDIKFKRIRREAPRRTGTHD